MYQITKYGWFSTVVAIDPRTGRADTTQFIVRSRTRDFLDRLAAAFPALIPADIQHTPDRDYHYRVVISRESWVKLNQRLAEQVDYTNVKDEISRVHRVGSAYATAVHRAWAVGLQYCSDDEHGTKEVPIRRSNSKRH